MKGFTNVGQNRLAEVRSARPASAGPPAGLPPARRQREDVGIGAAGRAHACLFVESEGVDRLVDSELNPAGMGQLALDTDARDAKRAAGQKNRDHIFLISHYGPAGSQDKRRFASPDFVTQIMDVEVGTALAGRVGVVDVRDVLAKN